MTSSQVQFATNRLLVCASWTSQLLSTPLTIQSSSTVCHRGLASTTWHCPGSNPTYLTVPLLLLPETENQTTLLFHAGYHKALFSVHCSSLSIPHHSVLSLQPHQFLTISTPMILSYSSPSNPPISPRQFTSSSHQSHKSPPGCQPIFCPLIHPKLNFSFSATSSSSPNSTIHNFKLILVL